MVVESQPHLLEVIRVSLEDFAFEVEPVSDGGAALTIVGESRPDLILLDEELPDRSGREVCRELKGNPDVASLPVVMLCPPRDPDQPPPDDVGADLELVKPFSPVTLLSAIHQSLDMELA